MWKYVNLQMALFRTFLHYRLYWREGVGDNKNVEQIVVDIFMKANPTFFANIETNMSQKEVVII